MTVEVTAKKWGNSLGIIIPKDIANELSLHDGAKIIVEFKKQKRTVLEEAYGAVQFKESTEELLAETRKGFSKWIE